MKSNLAKVLTLVLAVSLLLTAMPVVTLAEDAMDEDGRYTNGYYIYTLANREATIEEVDQSISGDVTIPDTLGGCPVTVIGDSAFYNCESLTSVTIGNSVTIIGEWAFACCNKLTSVTIPDDGSVTTIGEEAFYGCESLTSVAIPDSVTTIRGWAFYSCTSLTSITIPASVTKLGWHDYDETNSNAFVACDTLTSITVDENNPVFHSNGNCIIETATGALLTGCKNSTIPSDGSVTTIGEAAFCDCKSLTSVTIPDSVTTIGRGAFYGCKSLTSVTIPDSVTTIGAETFCHCESLTSITIPASVTKLGWYDKDNANSNAFVACDTLTSITVDENNPVFHSDGNCIIETATGTLLTGCKNSTIPDDGGVTTIGYGAFGGCDGLTSVTIPDSVTTIGDYAFFGCTAITDVYYAGDSEDWGYVKIEKGNEPILNANMHFNATSLPEPTFAMGDVNGDGTTDAKDALAVLKHAVGKEQIPAEKHSVADMNEDGAIDAKDALAILKKAVGK